MDYALSQETLNKYRDRIWDTIENRPTQIEPEVYKVLLMSQNLPGVVQTHSHMGDMVGRFSVNYTYRATREGEDTLRSMLNELVEACIEAGMSTPKIITEIDQMGTTDKEQRWGYSHRLIWTPVGNQRDVQQDRYIALHRAAVGRHAVFNLRAAKLAAAY